MFSAIARATLLVSALGTASEAHATVIRKMTVEQLTIASPLVVRGTVGAVQVRWTADRTAIATWAAVRVTDALKGASANFILVRQIGGQVGDVVHHIEGAAKFVEGEDVVLFLEPTPDESGVYVLYAMAAAKVTLAPNPFGELRATRALEGLAEFDAQVEGLGRVRTRTSIDDLGSVPTFLARVKSSAKGVPLKRKVTGASR